MQDRIEVYGSEGMMFIDNTHANPLKVYSDAGYSYVVEKASTSRGWTSPMVDERVQFGFLDMLNHFVQVVLGRKELESTGEFGRDVLRVIFAGYESTRLSKAVEL